MTISSSQQKSLDWPVIGYMFSIHAIALLGFLPQFFRLDAVVLLVFMHWVTGGLGVTLGFHRLVAHRSFTTPKIVEYFLVFCGTLACQGGPIQWVGLHRLHHKHSDTPLDPHDSHQGFWWSHFGWMIHEIPADQDVPRCTQDISSDRFYQFCQKYFIPIQVVLGLIFYALGGWSWVIWGIFVRLVLVFHCTWFVNSATHKFGYRSHESGDDSRNCWWVALLTYGEGWHNNHHAFQYSARHGLQWWEVDLTWLTIRLLALFGLANNIKLPVRE